MSYKVTFMGKLAHICQKVTKAVQRIAIFYLNSMETKCYNHESNLSVVTIRNYLGN